MSKKTKGRILQLARYLSNKHVRELLLNEKVVYQSAKGDNNIECFYWVLEQLPNVYTEWRINERGCPILLDKPGMCSLAAAAYYLGLDADGLFHLLVAGYQMPERYNGKHLHPDATPNDLVNNLYEFIRHLNEPNCLMEDQAELMQLI